MPLTYTPLDADDRPIISPDMQVAHQSFQLLSVTGECTSGSSGYSDSIKAVDASGNGVAVGLIGAHFETYGNEFGDLARLEIVDEEGTYYPSGTVVGDFGDVYVPVRTGVVNECVHYKRLIYANLYFRVYYEGVESGGDRKFTCTFRILEDL